MSLAASIGIGIVAAGGLALGYIHWRDHQREIGRQEVAEEYRLLSEELRAKDQERARAAEKRYTIEEVYRDKFIQETAKEVHHATENLAACLVDGIAVRLLNHAAECATGRRTAACGPDQQMRDAERVPGRSDGAGPE